MKPKALLTHVAILALVLVSLPLVGGPIKREVSAVSPHYSYLPAILNSFTPCVGRPTLIAPLDGSTVDTLRPLYQWDNGQYASATGCTVQVASDAAFQDVVVWYWFYVGQGIYHTRPMDTLNQRTTYFWRVALMCGDATGPWSDVWSFTTGEGTLPPAPSLISPANGAALASLPVTLEWQAVQGATLYEVGLWEQGNGQVYGALRSETSLAVPWQLDLDTTYEWQVRAGNDFGFGPWSPTWRFTTPAP